MRLSLEGGWRGERWSDDVGAWMSDEGRLVAGVSWSARDWLVLSVQLPMLARSLRGPDLSLRQGWGLGDTALRARMVAYRSPRERHLFGLGGDAPQGGEVTLPVAPGIYCALALDLQAGLSADTGDATPPVFAADVTTPEGEAMHLVATRRSGADIALDPPLEVTSRHAPRLDVRLHVAAWWDRAPYDQGAAEHIVDTLPHAITIEQP